MPHDTASDLNEPLALQHRALNDRQLEAMFDRVCTDTKVGHWVCGAGHFDITAEDLRDEINLIVGAVPDRGIRVTLELDYILRMIAWRLELSCLTDGQLEK